MFLYKTPRKWVNLDLSLMLKSNVITMYKFCFISGLLANMSVFKFRNKIVEYVHRS